MLKIKIQAIMKKTTITLTTLGLLAILSCGLIIHISCHKNDCKDCQPLSDEEKAFICYNQGDKIVFKNDSTNIFDTLTIYAKGIDAIYCSESCYQPYVTLFADFSFTHLLRGGAMGIQYHKDIPKISFGGPTYNSYIFPLSGSTQSMTVNGNSYNDIYSVQIDSLGIKSNGDQLKVPWKLYYSKSKGFVRFFMVDGQTWSKL
jgi:hypothetical protein